MPDRNGHFVKFTKMTGAGNDFVLIDNMNRTLPIDWPTFAPVACNRRYGIGADGLLVLEPSSQASFTMRYFNADGSEGGMCGNGGRCAAQYFMRTEALKDVRFEALNYIYSARQLGDRVELKMKDPSGLNSNVLIDVLGERVRVHWIDTGAPHAILFKDELTETSLRMLNASGMNEIGKIIRYHPAFSPGGTNVDLVEVNGDGSISMRTYERGVEDETLACGTGAVACSAIVALLKGAIPPVSVQTRSNEILKVNFTLRGDRVSGVTLEGSARPVFSGQFPYPQSLS